MADLRSPLDGVCRVCVFLVGIRPLVKLLPVWFLSSTLTDSHCNHLHPRRPLYYENVYFNLHFVCPNYINITIISFLFFW